MFIPKHLKISQSNRASFLRLPLEDIDDDKIIFYDIETDHQYATYAKIKMIAAQQGFNSKPELIDRESRRREFRQKMKAPDVIKVAFNNKNFDDIVLNLHGIMVHPQNSHDVYLMLKTISPNLPAYSLKFAAFYFLCDPHFPEMELSQYMQKHKCKMHECPQPILARYNKHDVNPQTVDLFRMAWDIVIRPEYWRPYLEDLMVGEPLFEMETEGGLYLDRTEIWKRLHSLQKQTQEWTAKALELTGGKVTNPNSSMQLGKYLTEDDNIELELTDAGNFCVKKSVLVDLKDRNPLAQAAYKIREIQGTLKYYENYLEALDDPHYHVTRGKDWIPVQYSISSASTRRFTSQSYHRINFQNPNKAAEQVQIVPEGFLFWKIDSSQVENVVHIYESGDKERQRAYEADEEWNEYVWLCNKIMGTELPKNILDEMDESTNQPTDRSCSKQIPHWTIYKQYKTGKLGMNFGMGMAKFCKLFGLKTDIGQATFSEIHKACPAIRELQYKVGRELGQKGYVQDAFGKRYAGPVNMAYKVVAYFIQGCGTGSLPKAQIRANWESMRSFDKYMPIKGEKCGVMCATTHDDNSGRIDLRLGTDNTLQLLQKLMFNMTEKFEHKFDGLPLRAKLYLSRTTAAAAEKVSITDFNKLKTYAEK